VIGALIGGFLFRLVGLETVSLIGELVAATAGAIVLLFVLGYIRKR
jgi:uncharacterized membrane protein YeaQ/YmgE (transglycosylase-associated protein family)